MSNHDRIETIRGLRELADLLETNPDVPVSPIRTEISFSVSVGDDDANRAEIDRIATALGVAPVGDGYRDAAREFSGGVIYRAFMVPSAAMARHRALNSYRNCVQPADETPAEVA